MARAPRFLKILALTFLACAGLRADYLLEASNKKLLASSPSTQALLDKLREDCPGFTLFFSRDKLPTLVQLRAYGPNRFEGVVNLDRVKASNSVPELAIASLYYMARQEVGKSAVQEKGAILRFLDKVRMELKHADPAAYGRLKVVRLAPE